MMYEEAENNVWNFSVLVKEGGNSLKQESLGNGSKIDKTLGLNSHDAMN